MYNNLSETINYNKNMTTTIWKTKKDNNNAIELSSMNSTSVFTRQSHRNQRLEASLKRIDSLRESFISVIESISNMDYSRPIIFEEYRSLETFKNNVRSRHYTSFNFPEGSHLSSEESLLALTSLTQSLSPRETNQFFNDWEEGKHPLWEKNRAENGARRVLRKSLPLNKEFSTFVVNCLFNIDQHSFKEAAFVTEKSDDETVTYPSSPVSIVREMQMKREFRECFLAVLQERIKKIQELFNSNPELAKKEKALLQNSAAVAIAKENRSTSSYLFPTEAHKILRNELIKLDNLSSVPSSTSSKKR